MRTPGLASLAALLCLVAGDCATSTADMPESEKIRVYAAKSFDEVWAAVQHSVSELKCLTVTTDKAGGSLQAKCVRSTLGAALGEAPWGLYVSVSQTAGGVRVEANSEYLHPQAAGGGDEARNYVLRFLKTLDTSLGVQSR